MNRIFEMISSTSEGRRRLAASRLRREAVLSLGIALSESRMTHSQLAQILGKPCTKVDEVFSGDGDIRISTLAEYLDAMGQELILTVVPAGTARTALWREEFEVDTARELDSRDA